MSQYNNRIIYDLKRQYTELGAVVRDLAEFENALSCGCTKIVIQPNDLSSDFFDNVCRFIFERLRNVVFCVDEVHKFCTKHLIPPFFNSLITICQGDPYNIGVISITQRCANVHNDVISSSSVIITFRHKLPADIKTVSEMTGIPDQDIRDLPLYEYIVCNDTDPLNSIKRYNSQ